jgi:hypothetical protein
MGQRQIDIEEKIAIATEGLAPEYVKADHSVSNKDNVFAITEYLATHIPKMQKWIMSTGEF